MPGSNPVLSTPVEKLVVPAPRTPIPSFMPSPYALATYARIRNGMPALDVPARSEPPVSPSTSSVSFRGLSPSYDVMMSYRRQLAKPGSLMTPVSAEGRVETTPKPARGLSGLTISPELLASYASQRCAPGMAQNSVVKVHYGLS